MNKTLFDASSVDDVISETLHAIIGFAEDGVRLDKAVAMLLPDFSVLDCKI